MKKRILVTGGAGFIGTNLCNRLVAEGHDVTVIDNLMSSKKFPEGVTQIQEDISQHLHLGAYDEIYHLACPASPPRYQKDPIHTMMTSVVGTHNILRLAHMIKARVLFTSTSEIYGEPEVSPQPESYRGNVNPIGIRACYDEGKRAGETLMYDYHRQHGVDVRVARIFNTFGPHMDLEDGRVVTNFIRQMLKDHPITIYGNGFQTRSFCYVDDMVEGLIRLMESDYSQPVNLGNPDEISIHKLYSELWTMVVGDDILPTINQCPLPADDPTNRCPDISVAKQVLGWEPKISRLEGLQKTIAYAKLELGVE